MISDKVLLKSLEELVQSETHSLSLLANSCSYLFHSLTQIDWIGFYISKGDELILGPFQGDVACSVIKKGKGLCGTSYSLGKTVYSNDVTIEENYISCSSHTLSEIVCPIFLKDQVKIIFDTDSNVRNYFTPDKIKLFEQINQILYKRISELDNSWIN
jgi:GAF domain-containing protein